MKKNDLLYLPLTERVYPYLSLGDGFLEKYFIMEIERLRNNVPHPLEKNILRCLRSCQSTSFYCHHAKDPFTGKIIGTASDCYNGKWFWQMSLAYFVENYHISLPDEFIQDMANDQWRWNCPEMSRKYGMTENFRTPVRVLTDQEIDRIVDPDLERIEVYDDQTHKNVYMTGLECRELLKKKRQELVSNLPEINVTDTNYWYYIPR